MRALFAAVRAIFLSASAGATSPAPMCPDVSRKAYSWAELKRCPPSPSHVQSDDWAKARETAGDAYYVAEYCPDGKLQSLIKRRQRRIEYRYDFDYIGDKLFGVRFTDENGNDHLLQCK